MIKNKTFKKDDLATGLADNLMVNLTKPEAMRAVNDMMRAFTDAFMRGEDVTLRGFGTFKVVRRKARRGHIFKTGESVLVPEQTTVKFIPGKKLKKALNNDTK